MAGEGEYELVPVVKTPAVDPGDRIRIDVYCTGAGVPAGTELRVDCDADLVSATPSGAGQVPNLWVATHGRGATAVGQGADPDDVATDGGVSTQSASADPTTATAPGLTDPTPEPGTVDRRSEQVTLNPVSFDRNPQPEAEDYTPSYTVSDRPQTTAPPAHVEIRTDARTPAGEYEIPFTFAIPDETGLSRTTETVSVTVGSLTQRLRTSALSGLSAASSLF